MSEEMAALRDRLAQGSCLPGDMRLSRTEEILLLALLLGSPNVVSPEGLVDSVRDLGGHPPTIGSARTLICRARPKLQRAGLDIYTQKGGGYYLPATAVSRLRQLVRSEAVS